MKIRNQTDYPTREIRKILTQVHNETASYEGRLPQWKRVTFDIRYTRWRATSGHAYLGGTYSRLCFQRGGISRAAVARLAEHELLHLYGYSHQEMGNKGRGTRIDADDYPGTLEEKQPKPKPKKDSTEIQQERYLRLLEREKDWLTKKKRAETYLKKIRRSKRYYERVLGEKAALPRQED